MVIFHSYVSLPEGKPSISPYLSPYLDHFDRCDEPIAPGALVEKHESLEMAFGALDSAAEGALTRESLAMGIEARGETTRVCYVILWIYICIGSDPFGGTRDETDKLNRGSRGGDHIYIYNKHINIKPLMGHIHLLMGICNL